MANKKLKQKHSASQPEIEVRLDKWLWAARFCKTRSIARDLVQSGKVSYNGERSKPSRVVELGAVLKIPAGFDEKVVIVNTVLRNRQGAAIAKTMYSETPESVEKREKNAQARKLSAFHSPKPDSRPDKKQRRQIIKFKHQ
jgi:ribosome-associated heat shock protein Hsp15